MQAWYPDAVENRSVRNVDGGSYRDGTPFRGVLHTTESHGFTPSAYSYGGWHESYPHFTIVETSSGVTVYQHIPIDRAARALKNPPGGVQTNRWRAIQIEIVGKAAEAGRMSSRMLDSLARWMRWVEEQTGVDPSDRTEFHGPAASGAGGVGRMTADEWSRFSGWCGHQHVPENSHWDPGVLDMGLLLGGGAAGPVADPTPVEPSQAGGLRLRVVGVDPTSALNVRAGAGLDQPVVGKLAPDATDLLATGSVDQADAMTWYELILKDGGKAWASASYLEPIEDVMPDPLRVVGVDADDHLNIRSAPGIEHGVIGRLGPGADGVEATGARTVVGISTWVEVVVPESTRVGWAHGRYLETDDGLGSARSDDAVPEMSPADHIGMADDEIPDD